MPRPKYAGVTPVNPESSNPFWQYRLKVKDPGGKVIDTKIRKDSNGRPFLTARAAFEAKKAHEERIRNPVSESLPEPSTTTLSEIYDNYLSTEGRSKAAATLRKQDSMWRNHIYPRFGEIDINEITIVDLTDFLNTLYTTHSIKYVEGFVKFFYLLYGHADRLEKVDSSKYRKMFVDKQTRLKTPQMTSEDYLENEKGAVCYTDTELKVIESVLGDEDCNLRLAYLLGIHCGLRIGETFGLRFRDIDFNENTITIRRQMQYIDGCFHLVPVKTLKGNRTIPITQDLSEELWFYYSSQCHYKKELKEAYRNTERIFDEVEKKWLSEDERDFVNRKPNGELLTINSMKYWSKMVNHKMTEHYDNIQSLSKLMYGGINKPVDRKVFKYHICAIHLQQGVLRII